MAIITDIKKVSSGQIVLTGDRPTGCLHLGHYVGSLQNRVLLQDICKQYVMIADVQALTDNFDNPEKVRANVLQVALDYLAVGVDQTKTTIFIQSQIPQIAELTVFFLNLITINRLRHNPTIKTELKQKNFGENVPAGFLVYPISQAADILIVKGQVVPVGADQLPVLEIANDVVSTFNRLYKTTIFQEIIPLVPQNARLIGTDGQSKMSKSLNNAIFLSDSADAISSKVMSMYTDPNHLKITDPGKIEGNVVFDYLDVFDQNKQEVLALKEHYQKGGLGDVKLKKRLIDILENFIGPIRIRREQLAKDPGYVMQILTAGTQQTLQVAEKTMQEVRIAMKLDY